MIRVKHSFRKSKSPYFKRIFGMILSLTAVGFVLFGAYGIWDWWAATHSIDQIEIIPRDTITDSITEPDPMEIVTYSTAEPDEAPPEKCPAVSPNVPYKIELPSLGVAGCIQRMGIDQDNKIAVPTNIHSAGWFVDSPLPGEKGVSIIDGHSGGRYASGIFKRLDELNIGDNIIVKFGDGSQRQFVVASNESYSVEQTATEQFKRLRGVTKQLTLITCGDDYNHESGEFDTRVVVRSELI